MKLTSSTPDVFDSLDIVIARLTLMETTLSGMRQLRPYVGSGFAMKTLDSLIEEGESQLAEIKRRFLN